LSLAGSLKHARFIRAPTFSFIEHLKGDLS
jgi:hypothetical protein